MQLVQEQATAKLPLPLKILIPQQAINIQKTMEQLGKQ
jgi:hypothetical protein